MSSYRQYVPETQHESQLSRTLAELPAMKRQTSTSTSSSTIATQLDATIRDLAARQHGVVAREQLVRAGVPAHKIEYRLKTGRLRRLHRAV